MNFIIAVINDSYASCMTSVRHQQLKVKVDLIVERESIMSKRELSYPLYFPDFIVKRKAVGSEVQDETLIIQDFVNDVKKKYEQVIDDITPSG